MIATWETSSASKVRQFDVADLYQGPIQTAGGGDATEVALDEKLRQAYFWIDNNAIISPHYDVEYNDGPPRAKGALSGNAVKYSATDCGNSYNLLDVNGQNVELRIAGAPWTSRLTFDKTLVDERTPEHLLASYLESAGK